MTRIYWTNDYITANNIRGKHRNTTRFFILRNKIDLIMAIGSFRAQHHITIYCQHSSALMV